MWKSNLTKVLILFGRKFNKEFAAPYFAKAP